MVFQVSITTFLAYLFIHSIMTKTERLFQLLQILREHRYPLSAHFLAQELQISVRTVYRDIDTLQGQGADIEGEPGMGYVLKPGFILPPLMFNEEEIEALVLGSRWVMKKTDAKLKKAAQHALAKIASVLPASLKHQLELTGLMVADNSFLRGDDEILALIRLAIRKELKLLLHYNDLKGQYSERVIWPLGLGYFDQVRLLISWCELKQDFRHFRVDKIINLERLEIRYPKNRASLIKEWRRINNIPE